MKACRCAEVKHVTGERLQ